MMLTQADHRPAHLTRVHAGADRACPSADQRRLGVTEDWKTGPHQLTYRQTERTFGLVTSALAKDDPGRPPLAGPRARSATTCWKPAIPVEYKDASTALAVDWTDVESFSRPPPAGSSDCADPEASWGHRTANLPRPGQRAVLRLLPSAATMMREEHGPPVPELARRMTLSPATTTRPAPWSRC